MTEKKKTKAQILAEKYGVSRNPKIKEEKEALEKKAQKGPKDYSYDSNKSFKKSYG